MLLYQEQREGHETRRGRCRARRRQRWLQRFEQRAAPAVAGLVFPARHETPASVLALAEVKLLIQDGVLEHLVHLLQVGAIITRRRREDR